MRNRPLLWLRLIVTGLFLGFTGLLLLPCSTFGTVSLSMGQTFPTTVTVGSSNLSGSLSFRNTSTAPNDSGNMTVSDIKLTAGCGTSMAPCASPDPGVFSYVTAVGRTGTAFAGLTFTLSLVDPSTGEVQLVPNSPTLLGPPGSLSSTGVIDFTFNVMKSPTIDVSAAAGNQTYHLARATGTKDALSVTVRPSLTVTVAKAVPSLSAATPGTIRLGGSISNSATLSGGFNPSGTLTFSLFGPDNASCGGSPVFASAKPVNAGGTTTSATYTPTSPGTYRWVVVYSGDANNVGVSRDCNAPGSLVSVEYLAILSIRKATNNVTIVFNGLASHAYQVQSRTSLNVTTSWTTLPTLYVADAAGRFTFNETTVAPMKFYRGIVP